MNQYKFSPVKEQLQPRVNEIKAMLGTEDDQALMKTVIENMHKNAQMLASHGIDQWLSYGVYLPALERVFSKYAGESLDDFYKRTEYPQHIVEAYTVQGDDLATLVAADQYSNYHKRLTIQNTSEWCLNDDEQIYINLLHYPHRIKANIEK